MSNNEFISLDTIKKILKNIPNVRFGVLGDFCLDVYLFADTSLSEFSVETGLKTIPIKEANYYPGGAGNVAKNLASMGALHIKAFGVVGNDLHGQKLLTLLEKSGIDISSIKVQKDLWLTSTYTKLYVANKEQRRIDFGNFNRLSTSTENNLIKDIQKYISKLDILIINQQLIFGIYTEHFRKALIDIINSISEKSKPLIIVDSRNYSNEFQGIYRKLNELEAAKSCGYNTDDTLLHKKELSMTLASKIIRQIFNKWKKPVFLSRGKNGLIAIDENGLYIIPGLFFFSPIDSVGAGDSLLAGISAALACGASTEESAAFGNLVAGVTVTKLFTTGTATGKEIMQLHQNAMYVYRPELASSTRNARYLDKSEIEIVTDLPEKIYNKLNIKYAIFDHDGTISTIRQGWEEIMQPVMIRSILGEYYDKVDDTELSRISERVRDFIDKTTGVQTLVQMEGLINIIKEYGYVTKDKIKDAQYYKKLFNDELLLRVNKRIEKFKIGELDIADLTIKKSIQFLKKLKEMGVLLYLASGTDQKDVEREANALGYSNLFDGHIYGAIGKISHEPKRHVIQKILNDIGKKESTVKTTDRRPLKKECSLVVFGDGPVEIREGRRHGCLTIGIASNEVRRYGLNRKKRQRLIEAGADIVAPDFSQYERIVRLIFP